MVFVHVTSILGEEFAADGSNVSRAPERANVPVLRDALASAERVGVPADSELLVGFPATQIAALADELDADLVIVGSRHFKGAKRMLHGSTSRTLLDETRRPLLIVTEPAHEPALV